MKQFKNLIDVIEHFKDPKVGLKHLAALRWSKGMACPHCGSPNFYVFKDEVTFKCAEKQCNLKFNAKTKTIFENTKIPLQKWFAAIYLISSHKKGISSIQVGKDIDVTQKTAWFMMHRIRVMMQYKPDTKLSGTVEVDETFVGGKQINQHQSPYAKEKRKKDNKGKRDPLKNKYTVMGGVERDGRLILQHVTSNLSMIPPKFIISNVTKKATVYTDELASYKFILEQGFTKHETISHGMHEYARGEVSTNTIEGAFSLFKRGYIGIYHYMSHKHLQRYCDEFAYRYSTRHLGETERFNKTLKMCDGRLKFHELIADK